MSAWGKADDEEKETLATVASFVVKEQLRELSKLLDDWEVRLAQKVEQASMEARPHPPPRHIRSEPPPPLECSPPWQPHTGGSDSEQLFLPYAAGGERVSPPGSAPPLTLPGVIDTSPAPLSAVAPLRRNSLRDHPLRTLSGRNLSRRLSRKSEDDGLASVSMPAVDKMKGRNMMQLYDLTSKFDRRARIDPAPLLTRGALFNFVHSKAFTACSSFTILLNAILIGVQMNTDVVNAISGRSSQGSATSWIVVEIIFMFIFSIELVLRAISERRMFWAGSERKWNMLDICLILLSLADMCLSGASTLPNVSFARTLRVLRFTRILRIVRVMRFFQSFRLMVYSILNSLAALLWVFLLLLFVMYFFASVFIHGVTEHFKDAPSGSILSVELAMHFGSLLDALLALFAAICGGKDWFDLMRPLMDLGWFYGSTFIIYIFFVIFGVLNVVVGTFVDSAYQASQKDRDYVVQCEVERNKKYMEDIKTFFHEADTDRSGMLTLEEFETHLKNDKVKAYFQALELDISQARALFLLLDVDGSNEIELEEFIGGCMRMKGDAKSIDVNMLLYENEKMIAKWTAFMDFCSEKFYRLEQAVLPDGCLSRSPSSCTASCAFSPKLPSGDVSVSKHSDGGVARLGNAVDVMSRIPTIGGVN